MRNPNIHRALLLGNGINLLDPQQAISWGELLKALTSRYAIQVDLDNMFKPFPLAFDELAMRKLGGNSLESKLRNLKQGIRYSLEEQMNEKQGFNSYHHKVMQLGYQHVLTTNYDYGLEKSVSENFMQKKHQWALNRQERAMSLKRGYHLPNCSTKVWHIHGELVDARNHGRGSSYPEESIMIGYGHYSNYLDQIQEHFEDKYNKKAPRKYSILSRLRSQKSSPYWIDLIFTHNIDILGLGLDFSENHLWWLLNQRASIKKSRTFRKEALVKNEIRFFYPEIPQSMPASTQAKDLETYIYQFNSLQKAKAISEMLEAFDVKAIGIACNSYTQFYDRFYTNFGSSNS